MWLPQGQLRAESGGLHCGSKQLPFSFGHNLFSLFDLQLKFGFGDGGLCLDNGKLIIPWVQPKQGGSFRQDSTHDQGWVLCHDTAGHFRMHPELSGGVDRPIGKRDGPFVCRNGDQDVHHGGAGLGSVFWDLRPTGDERLRTPQGENHNKNGQGDSHRRSHVVAQRHVAGPHGLSCVRIEGTLPSGGVRLESQVPPPPTARYNSDRITSRARRSEITLR